MLYGGVRNTFLHLFGIINTVILLFLSSCPKYTCYNHHWVNVVALVVNCYGKWAIFAHALLLLLASGKSLSVCVYVRGPGSGWLAVSEEINECIFSICDIV